MNLIRIFTVAVFVLTLTIPSRSEDPVSSALSGMIESQVKRYADENPFVGAVTLVAKGDEVLDLQAHGVKNLETKASVEPDSIFKIHSFTKAITCTAALMLFEEGKYQFDDPISNWLPEYQNMEVEVDGKKDETKPAKKPIRVRHLFTHTSGISYQHGKLFEAGGDLASIVSALAAKPLSFEPGESWEYGMSIDVLGRLVEIWSERDFASFVDSRILEPLGMVDTAFFVPEEKANRQVLIYSVNGDSGEMKIDEETSKVPREMPEFCMPGGGLYSTAVDYFRFLRMIQNRGQWNGKRFLKTETIDLMTTNQVPASVGWVRFGAQMRDGFGYGYGFNTVVQKSKWDPDARVGECGWGGKASCHYWFEPEAGVTVITLEQMVPYRRSLEEVLKGAIYQTLK